MATGAGPKRFGPASPGRASQTISRMKPTSGTSEISSHQPLWSVSCNRRTPTPRPGNRTTRLNGLYSLAVLLPGLGVGVRRLHDTDRSGWWLLISLVPLVGFILLIIWLARPGDAGPNRFGPDPVASGT